MRWAELGIAVQATIVAVFALLIVSTLITILLYNLRPERNWQRLTQRIHTWWILATVFRLAMVVSRTTSIVFFAFASFLALKEFLSLIPTRRADRRVLFWAYLAIPLQYYWVYTEWYGMFIVFIPVYMFLLLPVRMISIGQTEGFLRAAGTLHWSLMTMVFSLSHAAFLLVLRLTEHPDELPGPGLVLYLVVLTQLNDVAQYLWGGMFGRRRVVPSVDRRKTWSGFLGGVGTTLALARVGGALPDADGLPSIVCCRAAHWDRWICGRSLHVGGETRLACFGEWILSAWPWRSARSARQPDLHGATLLPLRLLVVPLSHARWGTVDTMNHVLRFLFFTLIVRPAVLIVLGLNVRHRERIPTSGPAILVANHNSHLDTMVLMTLFPTRDAPQTAPGCCAGLFLSLSALEMVCVAGGGDHSAGSESPQDGRQGPHGTDQRSTRTRRDRHPVS